MLTLALVILHESLSEGACPLSDFRLGPWSWDQALALRIRETRMKDFGSGRLILSGIIELYVQRLH